MGNTFFISLHDIHIESENISELLKKYHVPGKEIVQSLLLLEEILVRLYENAGQTAVVKVYRVFGSIKIAITAHGEEYNPFENLSVWDSESEEAIRNVIFIACRDRLSYLRRAGKNCISINVHDAGSKYMYFTFIGMILGIFFGFGMKFFPPAASAFIMEKIFSSIQSLFMNAISLLMIPVLFFSLVTGFSSFSGKNEMGRISSKVIAIFLFTTALSIFIAFGIGKLFFKGEISSLPENLTDFSIDVKTDGGFSLISILTGIIPKNLVIPIFEGNPLQVIFLAFFAGIAMTSLGDKVASIRNIFNEACSLVTKMMGMVMYFMPLIAFNSMAMLLFKNEINTLVFLFVFLISVISGIGLLGLMNVILVCTLGRISPVSYLKKLRKIVIPPFMTSSSAASIPNTLEVCEKDYGVSPKISSFVIPLGATVNMNGAAFLIYLIVMFLAKISGVDIEPSMHLKLFPLTILLSVGSAAVPNSGFLAIATMLTVAGIPAGTITLLFGIWSIVDAVTTAANVTGDVTAAIIVAKSENLLDGKIYSK